MTEKILNQAEAIAIYDAMCALNNVGAQIEVETRSGDIWVKENCCGNITVMSRRHPNIERYNNQNDFAQAYKLA